MLGFFYFVFFVKVNKKEQFPQVNIKGVPERCKHFFKQGLKNELVPE